MPKISVIMSVYNEPQNWLTLSIQSILDQTFTDWEFLIVNDNPNNSENRQLISKFAEKDKRISILNNENNIGLTKSLNKALKVAKGKYIARMDADDISLPFRFERQIKFLESHPQILVVGSWTEVIDQDGKKTDTVVKYETNYRWVRAQFIQNSQIAHPAVMFHRVVNGELVQYDESVRYAQDYSLMVNFLKYGEIVNLPEILFCYRNSENQITSSKKVEQQTCAFKAQKNAFELFGFDASEDFKKLFFQLTIQRDLDQPLESSVTEFKRFFKVNKVSSTNSLELELIYGTFITYLFFHNLNSKSKTLVSIFKHSTLPMLMLGLKLCIHLHKRKLTRSK